MKLRTLFEAESAWIINQFDAGSYMGTIGPFVSADQARKFIKDNPDAFPFEYDIDQPISPAKHLKDMSE